MTPFDCAQRAADALDAYAVDREAFDAYGDTAEADSIARTLAESRREAAGAMKRLVDALGALPGSVRLPRCPVLQPFGGRRSPSAWFGAWVLWRMLDSDAEVEAEDASRWALAWRSALPALDGLEAA